MVYAVFQMNGDVSKKKKKKRHGHTHDVSERDRTVRDELLAEASDDEAEYSGDSGDVLGAVCLALFYVHVICILLLNVIDIKV